MSMIALILVIAWVIAGILTAAVVTAVQAESTRADRDNGIDAERDAAGGDEP